MKTSSIATHTNEFVCQMSNMSGKPIDLSLWFNYYAFDVMGDLPFGKSFGMLRTGTTHFILNMLHDAGKVVGALGPVPWMILIIASIQLVANKREQFLAWCGKEVEQRKKVSLAEKALGYMSVVLAQIISLIHYHRYTWMSQM